MKKTILIICLAGVMITDAFGQSIDDFNAYKEQQLQEFNAYKEHRINEFEEYRRKCNEEYADYVRNAWIAMGVLPEIPRPKDEDVPPVVLPDFKPLPIPDVPKPVPFGQIIEMPHPQPQPQPIVPIEDIPVVKPVEAATVAFTFFGTEEKVRIDKNKLFSLRSVSENAIADAWDELSGSSYTNLLHDCLKIREKHCLCDWAYLQTIKQLSLHLYGSWSNEARLLTTYIFCQSGYRVRLASSEGYLYPLIASEHIIFCRPYFTLDGIPFYPMDKCPETLHICNVSFPHEQSMSLWIEHEQLFTASMTESKTRKSKKYPDVMISYQSNRNLMDFYDGYPASKIGDNMCTQWAMYANTPMSENIKKQIYPKLKQLLSGKTDLEAANILLNLVQTGFEYGYDDKIWGGDRAFFSEESLFYPYCDCEDRSILYTRLVRDILGLDCLLVYYPHHLATAVNFTSPVNGDYIELNGKRFTIADPTITYGAPVGQTMDKMDNSSSKVILLK